MRMKEMMHQQEQHWRERTGVQIDILVHRLRLIESCREIDVRRKEIEDVDHRQSARSRPLQDMQYNTMRCDAMQLTALQMRMR